MSSLSSRFTDVIFHAGSALCLALTLTACGGGGGGGGGSGAPVVTLPQVDEQATIQNLDPATALPAGKSTQVLNFHGGERDFLLYVPTGLSNANDLPLLFSFHGLGGTMQAQYSRSRFDLIADSEDFLLITPQAEQLSGTARWNLTGGISAPWADDAGFIVTLIDILVDAGRVDPDRVYATGYSDGGYFSFELACLSAGRFAAVASVAGAMLSNQLSRCQPTRAMPVMQIHGTSDDVVPYSSAQNAVGYWRSVDQTGATPAETALPDTDPNDGRTVTQFVYGPGINNASVVHLRVNDGEHAWPGSNGSGDIDSSAQVWVFLDQYDRNGVR